MESLDGGELIFKRRAEISRDVFDREKERRRIATEEVGILAGLEYKRLEGAGLLNFRYCEGIPVFGQIVKGGVVLARKGKNVLSAYPI